MKGNPHFHGFILLIRDSKNMNESYTNTCAAHCFYEKSISPTIFPDFPELQSRNKNVISYIDGITTLLGSTLSPHSEDITLLTLSMDKPFVQWHIVYCQLFFQFPSVFSLLYQYWDTLHATSKEENLETKKIRVWRACIMCTYHTPYIVLNGVWSILAFYQKEDMRYGHLQPRGRNLETLLQSLELILKLKLDNTCITSGITWAL